MSPTPKLAAAMVKVQAALKTARKVKENPHLKSKYADLGSVWEACHEALTENEIAVIQAPQFENGILFCDTTLLHSSGEERTGRYLIRPTREGPQDYGSAFTYARRYSLAAMVGIIQDDDDAIKGSTRGKAADTGKVAAGLKGSAKTGGETNGDFITKAMGVSLCKAWRAAGIEDAKMAGHMADTLGVHTTDRIRLDQYEGLLRWIKENAKK